MKITKISSIAFRTNTLVSKVKPKPQALCKHFTSFFPHLKKINIFTIPMHMFLELAALHVGGSTTKLADLLSNGLKIKP